MTKGGQRYYLAYDQVGTLRAVTDASGNAVKRVDYDSFGNVLTDSDPLFAVPFGFAGGLYDADTGLIRFGYRDYDPDAGRWTAKDPIGFAGGDTDLYGYCLNDPVNFSDSYGLMSTAIWGEVGGGLLVTPVPGARIVGGAILAGTAGYAAWQIWQNWQENTEDEESPCPEGDDDHTPVKPPFKGEPGSTVQGKKQSRTYGKDGKPQTDRDLPHPGGPKQERKDHSHDWGPDGRGPARDPKPGDPPQPKGF
ncbi:hypothetical protein DENIS_0871 [Desulfonema ishimotonii]|uniref:Teneurin-like YD-shell domain-containing protein n=2 Tax=Desulfonema ishimotonii TaxID=45657 RepID=A0A401FSI5_9BACT|nr:hypothetical protein DENIS_0871 [Desulfonema ishimotonii]